MTSPLRTNALAIQFPGRRGRELHSALAAISLHFQPGQICTLLGPNGSGKSTLLLALAGLLQPTSGSVTLGHDSISSLAPENRAARISCLFQNETVSFDFTAEEIVRLGTHTAESANQVESKVTEAFARLELSHIRNRPWSELSGGERQRVQIARALASDGDFLLLDEPMNHLDLRARALLLSLLAEEARRGKGILFSAHDLTSARLADQVVLLSEGRHIASGPPASVLTQDLIREVFSVDAVPLVDPDGGAPSFRITTPFPDPRSPHNE